MACRKRKLELLDNIQSKKANDGKGGCEANVDSSKVEGSKFTQNQDVEHYLTDLHFYILPAGIQKTRLTIFKNQILRYGGQVYDNYSEPVHKLLTHIIVDDKMDIARMNRILHLEKSPDIPIVKSAWLSLCLRNKALMPRESFTMDATTPSATKPIEDKYQEEMKNFPNNIPESTVDAPQKEKVASRQCSIGSRQLLTGHTGSSDYSSSEDERKPSTPVPVSAQAGVKVEKWICAQSSKNPKPNYNKNITDKLEEMARAYESTNDKWRAFGYQKAIQALRSYPKPISSWEEARSLRGVGGRLADKIWEIAQSGDLRKLKEFDSSEEIHVLKLFTNVWGAGPHTAKTWYQQGLRSIEDLKQKAHLNHQQEVGVRLYDDLLERMPREEAAEIEQVVRQVAESIQDGIIAQACGSYRRGKPTCGDVDVLITHPDGKSHKGIFSELLAKLKESGFLTDDLVSVEQTGNQKKYLGVCRLPGPNRKHRRLDIIVVPYHEYGCALVYFTGSAHFNRSLRHLCKTQRMSLNEHALKTGVVRKGSEKIYEGTVIPTPSEESVFEALKIPYRPPEERDH